MDIIVWKVYISFVDKYLSRRKIFTRLSFHVLLKY